MRIVDRNALEATAFEEVFRTVLGRPRNGARAIAAALNDDADWLYSEGLSTVRRLSHFLGQCAHESGHFNHWEESFGYTRRNFENPSRVFNRLRNRFHGDLDLFLSYKKRGEDAIASRLYANDMGNGPEESGDGYRFRGRGIIQLTGRENYERMSERLQVDLVGNPDLLARDPLIAVRSAAAYFRDRGIFYYADQDDICKVTSRINGGTNHLDERRRLTKAFREALAGQSVFPEADGEAGEAGTLRAEMHDRGLPGTPIADLQASLRTLGFLAGPIDGDFGAMTYCAVIAFQAVNDLPPTGIADLETQAAVERAVLRMKPDPSPPRPKTSARKLKEKGIREPADAGKVAGAAAATGGAAAVAGADEVGLIDILPEATTGTETEAGQGPPAAVHSEDEPSLATIILLVTVVLLTLFILSRSLRIGRDTKRAYREARYIGR
jgi:putative chitinase